jgi:hypothetical protein
MARPDGFEPPTLGSKTDTLCDMARLNRTSSRCRTLDNPRKKGSLRLWLDLTKTRGNGPSRVKWRYPCPLRVTKRAYRRGD